MILQQVSLEYEDSILSPEESSSSLPSSSSSLVGALTSLAKSDQFGLLIWIALVVVLIAYYLYQRVDSSIAKSRAAARAPQLSDKIRLKRLHQQQAWNEQAQKVYEEEKRLKAEKLQKKMEEKFNEQPEEKEDPDDALEGFYSKKKTSGFQPWLDSAGPSGKGANIRSLPSKGCNTGS